MEITIPDEVIEQKIYMIREQKVMLDKDLAKLYGVETKVLNQAVKRNIRRFPDDFMFQLSWVEAESLRSQIVTLNNRKSEAPRRGKHIKYLPYAFTEHGVAMLSSVLNSERAVQVNVRIIRAFVKLRKILFAHKELIHKLEGLERRVGKHDAAIQDIFEAIRQLMEPPRSKERIIEGFRAPR